jgi:opacity protein-like surface antigen
MKRVLAMAVLLVMAGSAAHAQVPSGLPSYGGLSPLPYVNLLQPNINPAITYMGIVQPQLQAQSTFQQLQSEINVTRMMPGGVAPPRNVGVVETGYAPARFMQYQNYFNTLSTPRRVTYETQPGTSAAVYGRR